MKKEKRKVRIRVKPKLWLIVTYHKDYISVREQGPEASHGGGTQIIAPNPERLSRLEILRILGYTTW